MFDSVFKEPKITEVATDILLVDFLQEEFCPIIVNACESIGTWAANKRDKKYFTQDIHLKNELPDIYSILQEHLDTVVWREVGQWWSVDGFSVTDLFAIKYCSEGQTSLPLHHDDSFITGSVKLNSNYAGAELLFPRQNFSNVRVPIGSLLVFPGKITHPHRCTELESGDKFSLTIWTGENV